LSAVDRSLSDAKIVWRRYVDDFVLITQSQADGYRALSILSHALADYGLTLNRTKTVLLKAAHYVDYVRGQLGDSSDDANKLNEIDLYYDPYSDTANADYEELRAVVETLDIRTLLKDELEKALPDTFLVTQIGRTLRLHDPNAALQLCDTILAPANLHAFRASLSTILRGIAAVCADDRFSAIFSELDQSIDAVVDHSAHLLLPEASCLHYLRVIRFRMTQKRSEYVFDVYSKTQSETIRRSCIDCWRTWRHRPNFTRERNRWNSLTADEKRMLWYAASEFGDEGEKFRKQVRKSLDNAWRLGIERNGKPSFCSLYCKWTGHGN
jgi:hypothetical protein